MTDTDAAILIGIGSLFWHLKQQAEINGLKKQFTWMRNKVQLLREFAKEQLDKEELQSVHKASLDKPYSN